MAVLSLSLSPEATGRIYDLLVCLAKFGEYVSIEARREKLTITALNLSRTAYAAFALDATTFFSHYIFNASSSLKGGDRFTCQISNRALQSVFKGRVHDNRGRDTAIERCDIAIPDESESSECRLVVKMSSKLGMTKTHRLTYEPVEVMHALFDKTAAVQGWRIASRVLREYIEFFGPKTEQLDMVAQDKKAVFTSFTEKIQDGKEVLKQPLETAVAIHTEDFEDFHVQEAMHVVISVKDFKAIVTHAETLRGSISAHFSHPTRPLQFTYQSQGIYCEYTLMTTGDFRGASSTPNVSFISTRSSARPPSMTPQASVGRIDGAMPPPPRPNNGKPASSLGQRSSSNGLLRPPSGALAAPDVDLESLFVPSDEEAQFWDPPNYEQNDDDGQEVLGWDTNSQQRRMRVRETAQEGAGEADTRQHDHAASDSQGIEPTQRLSQLHGMFD